MNSNGNKSSLIYIAIITSVLYKYNIKYYVDVSFKDLVKYVIEKIKQNDDLFSSIIQKNIDRHILVLYILCYITQYIHNKHKKCIVFFSKAVTYNNVELYVSILQEIINNDVTVFIAKRDLRGTTLTKFKRLLNKDVKKLITLEEEEKIDDFSNRGIFNNFTISYSCTKHSS